MNDILIVVLIGLVALTLYALFGGADFGGGVWDALASGPRREAQREAIAHAMGPVWETNHVWLIFVIVLLFTCFPAAFAALSVALYVPLTFVLIGIIFRGAAFAFRSQAIGAERQAVAWGRVFGAASVITPFFFGAAVGGLAAGNFTWYSTFALTVGAFAVVLCAQIAAVFLTLETEGALREDFRMRAFAATITVAAAAILAPAVAAATTPTTFLALGSHGTLIDIALTALACVGLLGALQLRRYSIARMLVACETIGILVGWYIAQTGFLIPGTTTFAAAAAPAPTLRVFIWLTAIGALFLVPSLLLLFGLFKTSRG